MELNIRTVPKPSGTPSFSANKASSEQKGSWKKRRKLAVKTRARLERKHGFTRNRHEKSENVVRPADEFASGIEAEENPKSSHVNEQGKRLERPIAKQANRKRQRTRASDPSNQEFKLVGNIDSKREPDTQEAIGATLEIVGAQVPEKRRKLTSSGKVAKATASYTATEVAREPKESKNGEELETGSGFGLGDFESVGLYSSVARHMKLRMGMEKPTQIQERVLRAMFNIPSGSLACDVLVRSATGSGKTLSYLLPIAHYLLDRKKRVSRDYGSFAIIIVPTRELAEQVESVASKVFRPWHWIVVGSVRGGEAKKSEKARLRKGVSVLVATPGRLLDHIRNTRSFQYSLCEFLVLDEADRLLDLGFEADIKEIIDNLNRNMSEQAKHAGTTIRSNIMLSATMRADVERLAKFSLKEPVQISVEQGADEKKFSMPSQLRQHLCIVEQRHRLVTLAAFLRLRSLRGVPLRSVNEPENTLPGCKIMVFFSTCDSVEFHFQALDIVKLPDQLRPKAIKETQKLIPSPLYKLHGNMDQAARLASLRAFRECRRGILLCTDVAARGLDLPGVGFSMQYDPPTGGQGEELEYVHRAGRTARMGEQGDALLFLLPSERAYKSKLEKAGVNIKEISNNTALAALLPGVQLDNPERVSYAARLVTSELQEALEEVVKGDQQLKEKAYAGYLAYCRAYATHAKDVKHYFHVRNLHLGHVARAFALTEKPAELGSLLTEIKAAKAAKEATIAKEKGKKIIGDKASIARAIADGEQQPFNDQSTSLARRRRQRGIGAESLRELASEFAS